MVSSLSSQKIMFFTGVIQASDPSKGVASITGSNGPVTAYIPTGPTVYSAPMAGEVWRYYFSGSSWILFDRTSERISSLESSAFPGDVIIHSPGNLLLDAQRVDIHDAKGDFFDPVTGRLNPDRLPQ